MIDRAAIDAEECVLGAQKEEATVPRGLFDALVGAGLVGAAVCEDPSDRWRTPPNVLDPIRTFLGAIDLDPCGHPESLVGAGQQIVPPANGLEVDWKGRVFCNPPYSDPAPWVDKCWRHALRGDGEAVALLRCDPSTVWWQTCWRGSVAFPRGRVRFLGPEGRGAAAPFPSAIVYWGARHPLFGSAFRSLGRVVIPLFPSRP